MSKSNSERLLVVNEVKINVINNSLENELASKILFKILDDYYENGTVYENKTLSIKSINKKYVISLYNDKKKQDVVKISVL